MPSSAADPNLVPVDNPILGMIDAEAARQGVDRNLAHVVAQMESGYNPRAVSGAGAQGVFQLMPDTAKDMGVADPMNPAQNIRGGIKYLATLGRKYGPDDTVRILAGYNAGPGNVDKYRGVPPFPETANYVEKGTRLLASASPPPDLSADPNLTPVPAAPSPGDLTPVAPAPSSQRSVEVLPPLTEPPSGKPAAPEKTFKGFLDNATMGFGRILEPLTDPAGTLENVTNLLQGMSEKSGFAPVMGQPKQQVVDGIVNLYKHRYGSLEGFKNAFYEDPVGIAADVATVFSGAGLGYDAAQDFLKASGLTQHAADIAKILPEVKAAATAGTAETRIQAGVQGAVDALGKRYKEVVQAGFERAPTGVLGGPHGMLGAAKYGAGKKAAEILKEGWQAGTKAFDASAAAPAAEAGAAAPAAAAVTPPDLAERAAQASMSPRVMLRSEAAQVFPEAYGQPAPAAEPPTASAAPPLTPQELTELSTGRPPSRQTEAAQQTAAETLATAQGAAPPAAPVAPEAPPAAPAVPPAPEAPTGPPVDPVAFVREQLAAGNRVSEATLQRQFGMKYSAARKLLKDLAPPATSAEGKAAFEQAKASGQPAVTPTPEEPPAAPEPPSDLEQQLAASIREAQARKTTPAPGQTVAEALAAQAPPGPKSLAELMAGIPERPELEKLDFAHITRTRNVDRLYDTMTEAGITPEMVDAEGDAGWAAVAKKAKIGPKGKAYVPSETTKAQLRQRFAGEGPAAAPVAAPGGTPPPQTPPPAAAAPEPPSEFKQQLAQSIREAQARKATPAKEPWQMTRQEFLDTYAQRTRTEIAKDVERNVQRLTEQIQSWREAVQKDPSNPALGSIGSAISEAEAKIAAQKARLTAPVPSPEQVWTPAQIRWHHVEYALRQGKPVPPEVLAEYPELQQPASLGEIMQPKPKRRAGRKPE